MASLHGKRHDMEHTTFLGHYRISTNYDGAPRELGRAGTAITYKATDSRSGEPVSLKLIPIANIDPEIQKQFEEQARTAQQLHHINIVKVLDFGQEAGQFVYVSEYLEGETVDSWIEEHGPMPPDAVLRVAAQVVSALSAASFHRLTHRAIQPSNLLIVPGPTAEGGWPFVKLIDVSSAGPKLHSRPGDAPDVDSSVARQFASPEQLQHGTVDFRSAIYSLGATMYFLLTGAAPPAKVRLRELRRFPKALRNLLAHMLRGNPNDRPQDLAALEKEISKCLTKIEKRHAFGRALGIPLAAVTPKEPKTPPTPLAQVVRGTLVAAGMLLAVVVLAAFLLPDDINPFRHRTTAKQVIGVPIGVANTSPSTSAQATNATPIVGDQPIANASPATQNLPPNIPQEQTQSSQPTGAVNPPNAPNANSNASTQADNSGQEQATPSAQANVAPQPATANESSSRTQREKAAGLASNRARTGQSFLDERDSQSPPRRGRSGHARVVGITSDGKLIFRLPSGRTTIVAPDSDEDQIAPRRRRRLDMERGQTVSPPSSELDNFPND
jgi:serine/threonine protein kinase